LNEKEKKEERKERMQLLQLAREMNKYVQVKLRGKRE